ncbi:MAG: hypothetical protein IIA50_06290, partial [Bacteroidetes bacterium]|nr:hypothetical protein [Bacteroidota bacterium]
MTESKSACTCLLRLEVPAYVLVAFAILTGFDSAAAQNAGWTALTSFREVRAIDGLNRQIWVATTGGVFSYDTESGELNQLTVVDGLHSVEAAAITIDEKRGLVWVGYSDGALDRIDLGSRDVITYRDIERARQFSSRGINRIVPHGDSLLIATDFGIVVFDPLRSEVRDSYSRFGGNQPATPVFDIAVGADASGVIRIWAATTDGVAHAAISTVNLQDPVNWSVDRSGLAPGAREIRSLAFFGGELYAGTAQDLYRRNDTGGFVRLFATGNAVTQLVSTPDRLIGVERFQLIVVEQNGAGRKVSVSGFQNPVGILDSSDGNYWFGDGVGGLTVVPAPSAVETNVEALLTIIPRGPYDGLFSDLEVDLEGNLWAGGVAAPNSGFHKLDLDQKWTTYSSVFFSELEGRKQYTRIAVDLTGTGWAGSEGGGLAKAGPDGSLQIFDTSNSSLQPAVAPNFIIVGGVDT